MSQLSLLARQHVDQRQGNDLEVRHIIHLKTHQTQTCHMKFMLWSKKTPGDLVSSLESSSSITFLCCCFSPFSFCLLFRSSDAVEKPLLVTIAPDLNAFDDMSLRFDNTSQRLCHPHLTRLQKTIAKTPFPYSWHPCLKNKKKDQALLGIRGTLYRFLWCSACHYIHDQTIKKCLKFLYVFMDVL